MDFIPLSNIFSTAVFLDLKELLKFTQQSEMKTLFTQQGEMNTR